MSDKQYLYSEIFGGTGSNPTFQGEGRYAGVPTLWLRLFGCNLQCDGFGQKHPTKPETWHLPYKEISNDISNGLRPEIKTVEDLPVFSHGCDSSYSWSAGFKKLQRKATAKEIAQKLIETNSGPSNPNGEFYHPKTNQYIHLCFTGGEPLMPMNQRCIIDVLTELVKLNQFPRYITFETNGTHPLLPEFVKFLRNGTTNPAFEILFSISPKLFTVSGELNEKAIKPEVIASYAALRNVDNDVRTQLKFVLGKEDAQWEELERVRKDIVEAIEDEMNESDRFDSRFKQYAPEYWIMPLGATVESQEQIAAEVSERAIREGYNVASRVHAYVFKNVVGK